jgi:hypothetical protein
MRQKLPLAGSKSNFRFTPESRLNSEIAACPKSANNGSSPDLRGGERSMVLTEGYLIRSAI